jgi:phage shock protein B
MEDVQLLGILVAPFILFTIFVLPVWLVMHYLAKIKTAKGLSKEDEGLMSELWELAARMEARIDSLEAILDDEVPGWRSRG